MDPGLAGTGMRILVPDRATVEALAAWRRDAFEVGYLHVERTYTDDGFPARDVYIILQDGRINRQPGPYLYEAMAKFVVDNGL